MKRISIIILVMCVKTQIVKAQNPTLIFGGTYKEYLDNMSGLSLAQPVCFSPNGKNVYIGSYNGFTWFKVNATDSLVYKGTLVDGGDGGPGVSDGHAVIVSPDNKFVYLASGAGEHSISTYSLDTVTGEPTFINIIRNGDFGISNMTYPYGIDMDLSGKNIYLACKDWDGNSIVWFDRNVTSGLLTYMGKVVDGMPGVDGLLSADDLDISPDGKHVYVTAFGDDAITWYQRDLLTGNLTYTGMLKANLSGIVGLTDPYWVEVSNDGQYVYVSSQADNSISWFTRNNITGNLTYVNKIVDNVKLEGVRGISIHPSGNWLFASSSIGDIVSWYSVNTNNGALTYAGYLTDNVGGIDGIDGTRYNIVSPNGKMFVATGYDESAVGWFNWTGESVMVKKNINKDYISVFPNPAQTEIVVNSNNHSIKKLFVYNSIGEKIKENDVLFFNGQTIINIETLNIGYYYYTLTNSTGDIIGQGRFVKN